MFIRDAFASHGWRRTGTINILIISSCGLLLLGCLLVNIFLSPSRSVMQGRIIFDGDCSKANKLGIVLHLIINIFSTGLLASSNFFMQVLSAPSRSEIDQAHRLLVAVEVGVPSVNNFVFLSSFKKALWVGLFLSSVPIHLLFNSAVYETNYEGSDWTLTMATDAFATGDASYFGPGASLANSGAPIPNSTDEDYEGYEGYGNYIALDDYWNDDTPINQSITVTAREAENWTNLTIEECYTEYRFCQPKKKYRDVVVVVAAEDLGWKRREVFSFNRTDTNFTHTWEEWDAHIPPDATNSLWFSAQCSNTRYGDGSLGLDQCVASGQCAGALGDPDRTAWTNTSSLSNSTWVIPFRTSWWTDEARNAYYWPSNFSTAYGFNESFNHLDVVYCLAEPAPEYACKVGVSNVLLLVVILCTTTKVAFGMLVIWKLPETSLVTLGDALESFISKPDRKTTGLGTLGSIDSNRIERQKKHAWEAEGLVKGPMPRKWHFSSRRFGAVITKEVWVRTYTVLSAGVALLGVALALFTATDGAETL